MLLLLPRVHGRHHEWQLPPSPHDMLGCVAEAMEGLVCHQVHPHLHLVLLLLPGPSSL